MTQLIGDQTIPNQTNNARVKAINMSFHISGTGSTPDGNEQLTLMVDWLAANTKDDALIVVAATETGAMLPVPTDNFNGITVGSSSTLSGSGSFNKVSSFNEFTHEPFDRVQRDIIAPGSTNDSVDVSIGGIDLTDLNNNTAKANGTSFAAPMVTGTVALLQQYGNQRRTVSMPNWSDDYQHHQVMKAVLMNSADKVNSQAVVTAHGGLTVPAGGFLGQSRTVFMQDGTSTWFDSTAADKSPQTGGLTPIDQQMGTGELNARRALQQLSGGEYHSLETANGPAFVPVVGWDYGHSNGQNQINAYSFNQNLLQGSFISITLAFDRVVQFATGGSGNTYHANDTFQTSSNSQFPGIDMFSNLDLYLYDTRTGENVAISNDPLSTIDHIFFQIPTTDPYQFYVKQDNANAGPVDYAVAWWALGTGNAIAGAAGDINQDGHVDANDILAMEKALANETSYAQSVGLTTAQLALIGDVNGDGQFTNADIQSLLNFLKNGNGSESVPEPASLVLLAIGGLAVVRRRRAVGCHVS